jgi:hypothetical protein
VRNANHIVEAKRTPFRILWNQEEFLAAGAGFLRRNAARPATSKAAEGAHAAMALARWASSRAPYAIVCHSSDNWARLSSLSAINSCFRNSSGLT